VRLWPNIVACGSLAIGLPAMAQNPKGLMGPPWECRVIVEAPFKATSIVAWRLEFGENGALSQTMHGSFTRDGVAYTVDETLTGKWRIEGKILTIELEAVRLKSASINGVVQSPDELGAISTRETRALDRTAKTASVVELSPSRLRVRPGPGSIVVCERHVGAGA